MLQKLVFRPGIRRDLTSLAQEGGWYACDKVRFRGEFPQKIGGWQKISDAFYLGICRSLMVWRILANFIYTGVGTHLKFYVEFNNQYNDITPIVRTKVIATNAFTTTSGSKEVVVNDVAHGAITDAFVIISGTTAAVGGVPATDFNGEFRVKYLTDNTYSIFVATTATSTATGAGATFNYLLNPGLDIVLFGYGWGVAQWGQYAWGEGLLNSFPNLRIWTQVPYGQDLIFGPKLGAIYHFTPDADPLVFSRGVLLSSLPGASSVPLYQFDMVMAQSARILVVFGTNPFANTIFDPLLVRWSDAGNPLEWAPSITNQSGEYVLPSGSTIVKATQSRQEIVIFTNTAVYTMQYIGAPIVFAFVQQADNISIVGPNATASANGVVWWMGVDKFYAFDGRVQTVECPLLDHVFKNINTQQAQQVVAGTNEGFDEVWWYYCSAGATAPDRYVIYNHTTHLWSYGTLTRTAWVDSPFKDGPLAATTIQNLVTHEIGIDDVSTDTSLPIVSYIESADFDIGDGDHLAYVRRILPDLTFVGSTASVPAVTMTVYTKNDPGAGLNANENLPVYRTATIPVAQWTPEIWFRDRGRVMNIRIDSTGVGVQWKMGTPRLDVRPSGRRA